METAKGLPKLFVIVPNLKFAGTSGKPDTHNCCHERDSWWLSISGAINRIAILAREGLRGTLERHVFMRVEKIERLKASSIVQSKLT